VRLYDAMTGACRASYCPYNELDEMASPTVFCFHPDGGKFIVGGWRDRTLQVFDLGRPGREPADTWRLGQTRRSRDGQKGLVSALRYSPTNHGTFCVGTYAPGSIYLYDDRSSSGAATVLTSGHALVGYGRSFSRKQKRRHPATMSDDLSDIDQDRPGWLSQAKMAWFQDRARSGITQLEYAPNNEYILYSASRQCDTILSWDLRALSGNADFQDRPVGGLGSFETFSHTNQRIGFGFDATGTTLYTGSADGVVRGYHTQTGELSLSFSPSEYSNDTDDGSGATTGLAVSNTHVPAVNGVSFASVSGSNYLTVSTGSRCFNADGNADKDDESDSGAPRNVATGSLSLYQLKL
jgi:WD40 repeat protein